jgi:general secretion pathway protein F
MPIFQYKAYTIDGKEANGNIEAGSLKLAGESLRKSGLFPKEIAPSEGAKVAGLLKKKAVSLSELSVATRQLSTLLSSGAALFEALGVLSVEEENPVLANALISIKEAVAGGSSLARALEAHRLIFPEMYIRTVEAGEASGSLDKALLKLSDLLEARATVNERVRSALVYPAIMTAVGMLVLLFLFVFVIPKISAIFEDMEQSLPLITVALVGLAGLLRTFWPALVIIGVIAYWALKRYLNTPEGKEVLDAMLLKAPVIKRLVLKFYMAGFSRTLGSLLGSGVPILVSLDITKRVLNNSKFEAVISKAIKDVTEGQSLSASLRQSPFFSGILCHMIVTGERSGELPGLLLKAAEAYEKEFSSGVERALSLLEPVLILIMGAIVGFIVLAVLLPIFQLNQTIR